MIVRPATADDAPAMGRVMVASWLAAHRGQVPEDAWRARLRDWTPEVSAAAWARLLAGMADGTAARRVLLVAEDDAEDDAVDDAGLVGVVLGQPVDGDSSTADVVALYVAPDRQGEGVGAALLRAAAAELVALGFASLEVGVLTANAPARAFYEAMGGVEAGRRTYDEEGHELAGTVYAWPDLADLADLADPAQP